MYRANDAGMATRVLSVHQAGLSRLDDFTRPSVTVAASFMEALEGIRQGVSAQAWLDLVRDSAVIGKWRFFLCQDPYTRWGLLKPRGYAGDGTLMDYVLGHESVAPQVDASGTVGRALHWLTFGAAQTVSARQAMAALVHEIELCAWSVPNATVMSWGAGHAREVAMLSSDVRQQIGTVVALDQDATALDEAERTSQGIHFVGVQSDVVSDDLTDLPMGQLVYAMGLFESFRADRARAVLRKMWQQTAPGGALLIFSLSPTAANLAYCEAIMGWWMVTRSCVDLQAFINDIEQGQGGVETATTKQIGCFNFLRMTKRR